MTRHALLGAILAVAFTATASAQTFKMTTPFAPGVAYGQDRVLDRTLNLDYGYPSATPLKRSTTTWTVRGASSLFAGDPIVNQAGMRDSIRKFGPITRPT